MKRYFFHAAYDGRDYHGWQRQTAFRSVQQVIEDSLAKILRLPKTTILGCGRTDAGVHASQYFFHLEVAEPLRDNFLFILNKTLPDDISIYEVIPVSERLHARYSARARSYDYFIHRHKDPFLHGQSSLYIAEELDISAMQQGVALFSRYQEYGAFCRQPHLYNNTLCRVQRAELYQADQGQRLRIHLTANRFLRGQIRILVRKLLDIGLGEYSVEEMEQAFQTGQRPATIVPAHPQGLFLSKVVYEGLELGNRSVLSGADWELVK